MAMYVTTNIEGEKAPQPWFENSLVLSLLTEQEQFNETKNGKWCMSPPDDAMHAKVAV